MMGTPGPREQHLRAMREQKTATARPAVRKTSTASAGKETKAQTAAIDEWRDATRKHSIVTAAKSAAPKEKTMSKKATKTKAPKATAKKPSAKKKPAARAAKAPKKDRAPKSASGVRPGSKLEIVVGLLTRPEGCTTADALAATGWPAISMPSMAKAADLTLTKEKDGSVTRYRAVQNAAKGAEAA